MSYDDKVLFLVMFLLLGVPIIKDVFELIALVLKYATL